MAKRKPNKSVGDDFEIDVQAALESLGFSVERNLLICGSQIDLVATRSSDIAPQIFIVEAKAHSSPIGVEAVRSFSSAVLAIRTEMPRAEGLFVSQAGFSAEARAHAKKVGITLYTYLELLRYTCDIKSLVASNIQTFEREFGVDSYIPLSCSVHESSGTIYKPVERFLDEFLARTAQFGCAVLGNFGTGKTSLCKHYAYILSQRWNSNDENFIPIYLALRDVTELTNLPEIILNTLRERYKVSVTLPGLLKSLSNVKFLFLFDGLDEMAARMDAVQLRQNLLHLRRFALRSDYSKIILTCRTHFFRTRIEEDHIPNFMRLYMCQWGAVELSDYVKSHSKGNADSVMSIIRKTYNLEELARIPMFLKMITDTAKVIKGSINQSKLYETYTEQWIQSQSYRSSLTPDDKRELMSALALEMWKSDRLSVHHTELPKVISHHFRNIDFASLELFDKDVRTCSFLVRDDSGNYRFVHKSYSEFFVGVRLTQNIKSNLLDEFSGREIPTEVASFVSCYFEADWQILIKLLLGPSEGCMCMNAISVIAHLRPSAELHAAIDLAASLHKGDKRITCRLIDCLTQWGDERAISTLLEFTKVEAAERLYALRQLGSLLDNPGVVERISDVLESDRDNNVIAAAIEAVVPDHEGGFSSLILKHIEGEEWRDVKELDSALMSYVQNSRELEFSRACKRFLIKGDGPRNDFARRALDELRGRYLPQVERDIRQNYAKGLSRGGNGRAIEAKFGFLADEAIVGNLLKAHDPKSVRR